MSIMDDYYIGDIVYYYNITSDEIEKLRVQGFKSEDRSLVLVEHFTTRSRKVVESYEISKSEDEINDYRKDYLKSRENLSKFDEASITSGSVVLLTDRQGGYLKDDSGELMYYQVIALYEMTGKVKLVDVYGDIIGTYYLSEVKVTDHKRLFDASDYREGDLASWVEDDGLYLGTIEKVNPNTVLVGNISKLYPGSYKVRLPLYKVPFSRVSSQQSTFDSIIESYRNN